MNNISDNVHSIEQPIRTGIFRLSNNSSFMKQVKAEERVIHPFRVIVNKEMSDHILSWRFLILLLLIALTCLASVYTGLSGIGARLKSADSGNPFFFLQLFTSSDGTLPPFFVFISFLGPLLGIIMGFDAINTEQTHGTLSRVLAQPIHRDYIINAKFLAALNIISVMFFSLGFLVMGAGLILTGIPPTSEEFLYSDKYFICLILAESVHFIFGKVSSNSNFGSGRNSGMALFYRILQYHHQPCRQGCISFSNGFRSTGCRLPGNDSEYVTCFAQSAIQ
jgi:hypothetical protein